MLGLVQSWELVVFGLGGILVEVLKDVTFRLAPVDDATAGTMLSDIAAAEVLRGAPVETAAIGVAGRFGSETTAAIRSALTAPRDGRPETVETLGGGWIAEEALAIALYAALASSSFEEGLRIDRSPALFADLKVLLGPGCLTG